MTQDEIIEMARQAGAYSTFDKDHDCAFELPALIAFAKLVAVAAASKEREACAKIAWNMEPDDNGPIETAIRARGEA